MRTTILGAILLAAGPAFAQHDASSYAAEEGREIASLSAEDLAELGRGGGWGLARSAELNGVPGPAHLLELAPEIGLDAGQVAAVEAVRDAMRRDAIAGGERLVAGERALDEAFRDGPPDEAMLRRLVEEAEAARAVLRLTHLEAHLAMAGIVDAEQVDRYNHLRGYADDPCARVPEGHDAVLWRRHNGCD